jgi:hypothetical protein
MLADLMCGDVPGIDPGSYALARFAADRGALSGGV